MCTNRGGPDRGPIPVVSCRFSNPDASDHPHPCREAPNRDAVEWLGVMADPLLAQSAVDRLKSAAWELVIEGESYRTNEKPALGDTPPAAQQPGRRRQST